MSALQRQGLALAALCMVAFVISLDTPIVNVALPSLVRQLHAPTTDLQRVVRPGTCPMPTSCSNG
jgi:hypothetical protein